MNVDITDSLDLLRRAQGGDDTAVEDLFKRYYERVRRIVRMRLGAGLRRRVDSGDILQDTFITAVANFDRFEVRDEASFISWLARIAERQILSAAAHHTAQKRDPGREVAMAVGAEMDRVGMVLAASDPSPVDALSRSEQAEIVEDCVAELTEVHRELIVLRDYAGASWETIAAETDRPSAAAARMMHATALVELGKRIRARRDGGARE